MPPLDLWEWGTSDMSISIKYRIFPPLVDCEFQCQNTPNTDGTPLFYSGPLKLDTGADITAFPAKQLRIKEDMGLFLQWIQKSGQLRFKTANGEAGCLVAAAMKGVDKKADPFQFFALQVDAFTILDNNSHNKIAIGGVPVFVTFDERFDKALLGRDIISLLNLNIDNDRKCIEIEETDEARNYKEQHSVLYRSSDIYKRHDATTLNG